MKSFNLSMLMHEERIEDSHEQHEELARYHTLAFLQATKMCNSFSEKLLDYGIEDKQSSLLKDKQSSLLSMDEIENCNTIADDFETSEILKITSDTNISDSELTVMNTATKPKVKKAKKSKKKSKKIKKEESDTSILQPTSELRIPSVTSRVKISTSDKCSMLENKHLKLCHRSLINTLLSCSNRLPKISSVIILNSKGERTLSGSICLDPKLCKNGIPQITETMILADMALVNLHSSIFLAKMFLMESHRNFDFYLFSGLILDPSKCTQEELDAATVGCNKIVHRDNTYSGKESKLTSISHLKIVNKRSPGDHFFTSCKPDTSPESFYIRNTENSKEEDEVNLRLVFNPLLQTGIELAKRMLECKPLCKNNKYIFVENSQSRSAPSILAVFTTDSTEDCNKVNNELKDLSLSFASDISSDIELKMHALRVADIGNCKCFLFRGDLHSISHHEFLTFSSKLEKE